MSITHHKTEFENLRSALVSTEKAFETSELDHQNWFSALESELVAL